MNPSPPSRGEAIDQDYLWGGIGSEYSTSSYRLMSLQSCVYFILIYFVNYGILPVLTENSYYILSFLGDGERARIFFFSLNLIGAT